MKASWRSIDLTKVTYQVRASVIMGGYIDTRRAAAVFAIIVGAMFVVLWIPTLALVFAAVRREAELRKSLNKEGGPGA